MESLSASNIDLRTSSSRGSVLITALVFAAAVAISLGSYLLLATNSLKLSHRTFLADSAVNLAETGLEEAVWSFNKMGNSATTAQINAAWTGWSRNTTIADIYMKSVGSGYTSAPVVTISGGGGSGATATANITTVYTTPTTTETRVSSITLTNPGTGYTSTPTVTLTGGGGTGASAEARQSATRTINISGLEGATGTVKVWVAGYNGTAVVPIIVAKASITPTGNRPVEKLVKVILSKNGILPKGLVAFNGINWNGHPLADSFLSSITPGLPPFTPYNPATARANTTVASLGGTIDLARGEVDGNVMTGAGVTVVGRGDISGSTIGNFTFPFTMPTAPTASYTALATLPLTLPRPASTDPVTGVVTPADTAQMVNGKLTYCYSVVGATIGALTVTPGANVIIKGTGNTNMVSGLVLGVDNASGQVATAELYIDGGITLAGNDQINATAAPNYNWSGSLQVVTTTTGDLSVSGNAKFTGCITAPNARLVGNGSGSNMADLCGSFIVGSVTSNGHMNFHYDEGLASLTSGKVWGLALWKELQSTADRALYTNYLNF